MLWGNYILKGKINIIHVLYNLLDWSRVTANSINTRAMKTASPSKKTHAGHTTRSKMYIDKYYIVHTYYQVPMRFRRYVLLLYTVIDGFVCAVHSADVFIIIIIAIFFSVKLTSIYQDYNIIIVVLLRVYISSMIVLLDKLFTVS